jgi:hypothetical protein
MIEPGMIELMNLAIDGTASPSERAALDHYLKSSPEARSYYEALEHLTARLDADPIPDPPHALESRVLDAIHNLPASTPTRTEEPSPSWRGSFFAPRLRPWSTFGLGLAAGLFIFAVVQYQRPGLWDAGRNIDPSNVSGSMVRGSHPPREQVGSLPVDAPAGTATGSLVVYGEGRQVTVDLVLESTVTVGWTITYDADEWTLDGIERRGGATEAFAANHGAIHGIHTGEGGLFLVFSGAPEAAQTLVLKVVQDGETVLEGSPAMIR